MKYFILLQLFLLFAFSQTYCQEKTQFFKLGIYAGEGTGVLSDFKIADNLNIEWNIAVNELFYKYNYLDKYKNHINQKYDNIYSTALLIAYNNKFKENGNLGYSFAIGCQMRIISRYISGKITPLPPETIIIDDPIIKTKFDIGLNPMLGLNYSLNDKVQLFSNLAYYVEMADVFLWSNIQFRTGLSYCFRKKK